MKIQNININKFNSVKDNFGQFLSETFIENPYDMLQFSSDLTTEDHKLIYLYSDGYKISKNVVNEDEYEILNNEDKNIKYEIVIALGRKYMNKLHKYPRINGGLLYKMRNEIKIQTKIILVLTGIILYKFC